MLPVRHRFGVFRLKHTASGQRAQQTPADLGLHFVEQLLVGGTAFVKRRSSRGVSLENALDDEAVEVHLRIEQRAKAVDEGHRADPGTGARRRAGAAQGLFHDAQENAQRQRLDRPILFEVMVLRLSVSLRQTHAPGEKLFIDYAGPTVPITDPMTGGIRQAAIFLAVLGASN